MSTPTQIEPQVTLTSFNCPHCGALAKQFWRNVFAEPLDKDATPRIVLRDQSNVDFSKFDKDFLPKARVIAARMASGAPPH